jgi:LPS O-antigen subunit length determinant protein (WzzB/FepE family)
VFGLYAPPDLNRNPLAREVLVAGEPSLDNAFNKLSKMMSLSTDKQSGLITFTLEGEDPMLITLWNELLIKEINAVLKDEMLNEASTSNEFLTAQLEKTSLAELRQAIYSIMESNVKTLILGETKTESVFKTIDPAVYPEKPAKPKRALIVAVGMVLGLMMGIFVALIRNAMRPKSLENAAG